MLSTENGLRTVPRYWLGDILCLRKADVKTILKEASILICLFYFLSTYLFFIYLFFNYFFFLDLIIPYAYTFDYTVCIYVYQSKSMWYCAKTCYDQMLIYKVIQCYIIWSQQTFTYLAQCDCCRPHLYFNKSTQQNYCLRETFEITFNVNLNVLDLWHEFYFCAFHQCADAGKSLLNLA